MTETEIETGVLSPIEFLYIIDIVKGQIDFKYHLLEKNFAGSVAFSDAVSIRKL